MTEPWRDQSKYQTGKMVKCLGCNEDCHKTHWGNWCYKCNVERIERINTAFRPFAKTQGIDI